jgi:FAD/FMN-containing dehydrogenase
MTGLTLGGGYGPLIGRFGLALDNLVSATAVLADGRIVSAGPGHEEELFWALRGGGGNFGVVTEMRHRLHPLPSVRSGVLIYPFSAAKTVLEGCASLAADAPDELTVQIVFAAPGRAPGIMIVPTWCGAPESGEAAVASFLKLGTLLTGAVNETSHAASLALFDPFSVKGRRTYIDTCWLPQLDSAGIGVLMQAMETAVSPGCAIVTHEFKGAASRVPLQSTAFGLRRDHVLVLIIAAFEDCSDPLEEQQHRGWTRAVRQAFEAIALPGGYPNLLARDDHDRAAESYGHNSGRLIEAKRRYDPDNVFRSAIPLPAGNGSAGS